MKEKHQSSKEQGFTLIELLIVIVIIGVLAAIALPIFLNQQKSAHEAAIKSDLKNAGLAMQTASTKTGGKFATTLPSTYKTSDGVTVSLANQSDSTNLASGQTNGGVLNPGSTGFYSNGVYPTITTVEDFNRATYDTAVYGGPYWSFAPAAEIPTGTTFTGSVMIRSSSATCFPLSTEQHKSTPGWIAPSGANVCLNANEWTKMTMTSTTSYPVIRITLIAYTYQISGVKFDYKNPVIVLGESINESFVGSGSSSALCLQGYHESDPTNIWRYSLISGGLKKGAC